MEESSAPGKKGLKEAYLFLSQKKVINVILIVLILTMLIGGIWIRTLNIGLLKDSTTGEYIPLALDPFYFLRVAETMIQPEGLPSVDIMRYPSLNVPFSTEILPDVLVLMYKLTSIFDSSITLKEIDILYPVIFFALGLIVFFFFVLFLTKSKLNAIISTGLLTIVPSYLYRTMAGFSDHDAIGMFAFFAAMLSFVLGARLLLNKDSHKEGKPWKIILVGLLAGFFTAMTIMSWGGVATFLFMIFPLATFLMWLIKVKEVENEKGLLNFIWFYVTWMASIVLFGILMGSTASAIIARFFLGLTSILTPFTLGFIVIDYILIRFKTKYKFLEKNSRYRILYTLGILGIAGIAFISITRGFFGFISNLFDVLLHPFGEARVGLTVAENKQPYLVDWIEQIGPRLFWIFYLGMLAIGLNISRGISQNKNKILFALAWIVMVSGIIFSRISTTSLLNGTKLISKLVLVGSLGFFAYCMIKIYVKDKIKVDYMYLFVFSWLIFTLIGARGAIRLFFAVTPFVCFIAGYLIKVLIESIKINKNETSKIILIAGVVITSCLLLFSSYVFISTSIQQAQYTGPSANAQWQNAMSWIRGNTPVASIFIHWWDYGYWVQSLGERPTVTDGGHQNGFWDHLIGRYLLTTPNPNTALSLMKAHNVSYLLIDPTDLGKYPAYSSIGDGVGETAGDRTSWIPVMVADPSQIQETNNETIRIYQPGTALDADIIYEEEGKQIFLPAQKAGIAGVAIKTPKEGEMSQPVGIYVYNGNQISIPLRYLYAKGKLTDFGKGVNATMFIVPYFYNSDKGLQADYLGAGAYLSPKVSDSLFAQLYLMDDPLNKYSTIFLAHSETDPFINYLRAQGATMGNFAYYQGFRGPIKIWQVDYPSNIIGREEFLSLSGEYAEFDDLQFTSQ